MAPKFGAEVPRQGLLTGGGWRDKVWRFSLVKPSLRRGWEPTVICPQCGTSLADNTPFCAVCGRVLTPPAGVSTLGLATTAGALPPSQTSGKAIVSLVLGIVPLSILSSVPAVVFGHIALSEIKKSGGRLSGRGLAIAGLVLGYLGIALVPFVLIIAAIAIPNLLRARIAANEASTVASLRTLTTAEMNYAASHPGTGFSCDLRQLVAANDLDPKLAQGHRNGYIFAAQSCTAGAAGGPNTSFQLVAYPASRNQSGVRAFCVDESSIIKYDAAGSFEDCLDHGDVLR